MGGHYVLLLPKITGSDKLRLSAGSSVDDTMARIEEQHESETEFNREPETAAKYRLNSPKTQ